MSVSVNPIPRSSSFRKNQRGQYSGTIQYYCEGTNPATDGVGLAIAAVEGIYPIGYEYIADNAYVTEIDGTQDSDDNSGYIVNVQIGLPEKPDNELPPWEQPADYEWDTYDTNVFIDQDIDGDIIQNSAKMPYLDGCEIEMSYPILTITKAYEGSFNTSIVLAYANSTNSTANPFGLGGAEATWAVKIKIRGTRSMRWGYYETVTYQLKYNPLTYDKIFLDAGLKELKDGKYVHIILDGKEATEPVPLNGSGLRKAPAAAAVFNTYQVKNRMDYSIFNIA